MERMIVTKKQRVMFVPNIQHEKARALKLQLASQGISRSIWECLIMVNEQEKRMNKDNPAGWKFRL